MPPSSNPIGEAIDAAYDLEQRIRRLNAKASLLRKKQMDMEAVILKRLEKMGAPSCAGKKALAGLRVTRHANVKDRRKLDLYVKKYKAYDLFTNHINSKAYFDRLEEGEKVPGIEVFERRSLSLTKRGSK